MIGLADRPGIAVLPKCSSPTIKDGSSTPRNLLASWSNNTGQRGSYLTISTSSISLGSMKQRRAGRRTPPLDGSQTADYAHRAAHCADPVGSNPPGPTGYNNTSAAAMIVA